MYDDQYARTGAKIGSYREFVMQTKKPSKTAAIPPDRRYEVEDAMRTLHRAEQIKKDAKLLADVRTHAKELAKAAGRTPRKG